jgi:hypothetical protein
MRVKYFLLVSLTGSFRRYHLSLNSSWHLWGFCLQILPTYTKVSSIKLHPFPQSKKDDVLSLKVVRG